MSADEIVDVWDDNLETEFDRLMTLAEKYNYIAMDTEFPGICYQGDQYNGYKLIKDNVDNLKLIQVGISLADENGETPKPTSTWQFNLKYDLNTEKYAKDSINLLQEAGINFDQLKERGIPDIRFADLLISSGLLLDDEKFWITFHGAFDFAYLLKSVINDKLPNTVEDFTRSMKMYFPSIYDLKIIVCEVSEIKQGSLSKLALDLDAKRSGIQHQAGSDAYLTAQCFFKIKSTYLKNVIPKKVTNRIFGLNSESSTPYTPAASQPQNYASAIEKQQQAAIAAQQTFQNMSNMYYAPQQPYYGYSMGNIANMNAALDLQTYFADQFGGGMNVGMFGQPQQHGMINLQNPYRPGK